jgi:VWFA-related protein
MAAAPRIQHDSLMKLWTALCLGLLFVFGIVAQQPPVQQDETIRVDVDIVNILATVRNKSGGLVANLNKEDFTINENGQKQEIKYFTRETDLPLTIGLLFDVSRSQENLIEVQRRAAFQFFSSVLGPKDLAFLLTFGQDAELLQDYTNSRKLLQHALDEVRLSGPVGGLHPGPVPTMNNPRGTVLFDAVYLAAAEQLKGQVGRKVLVILTDGVDQGSRYKINDAIKAAQLADVMIYSIYYADPSYGYYPSDRDVKRMAEDTGGRVMKVDRKNSLQSIFTTIQEEMRSQYAIGYSPVNSEKDGSFRKIEIKMADRDLKVQARKGYFAVPRGAEEE